MTPKISPLYLALVLSASSAVLIGCKEEHGDFLKTGKSYLEKRDYSSAVIQFKNAVEKDLGSAEAHFMLGIALGRSGDLSGAESQIRKAIDLGFDPNVGRPTLMELLFDMGAFEKVLAEAEKVNELTLPNAKASALGIKGDVLFSLQKVNEAQMAYESALAIDVNNSVALAGKARMALWAKDESKAREIVDKILAHSPNDVRAQLINASLLLKKSKTSEAIVVFDKIIETNPLHFFAYTGLIPALISQKDFEGAAGRISALKKEAPSAIPTLYLEALLAYSRNDKPHSRDLIRQVLKVVPDHTRALMLGGLVEHDLGNLILAKGYLEKLVGMVPNEVGARRVLASVYLRMGQVDKAQAEIAPILKVAADQSEVLALAGEVSLARGDTKGAVGFFVRAVEIDKQDPRLRIRLGQARLFAGDSVQGLQDLRAAKELPSVGLAADLALVDYYLRMKQWDSALETAKAVVATAPQDADALYLLGLVHQSRKEFSEARSAFERVVVLQPTSIQAALQLSSLDILDKEFVSAQGRFRKILEKDPRQENASLMLAELIQRSGGASQDVMAVLDSAIGANPLALKVRLAKIRVHLSKGEVGLALEAAQQGVATVGEDPALLLELARAQAASKEYAQAVTTYGKLSRLMQNSKIPFLGQVEAHAAEKNWSAAREAAMRAVSAAPDDLATRLVLVDTGIQSKAFRDAQKDAVSIQTKWPDIGAGYSAESQVLVAQGKFSDAETVLRKGLTQVKDRALVTRLAALLRMQGKTADADLFLENWASSHPKDSALLDALGAVAVERKDYTEAEKWYRRALDLQPDNAACMNNLAWVLGKRKAPEALELAQKAVQKDPKTAQFLGTLGSVYLELGKAEQALDPLRKAIELQPGLTSGHVNLARALISLGQKGDAKKSLEAAKRLGVAPSLKDDVDELEKVL